MTVQKLKKTTLSGNSFKLDTLDPNNYYDATLSGGRQSLSAHSGLISTALTNFKGDTITGTGTASTLLGGAGLDSLLALGSSEWLISGTGKNTLIAKGNASTLVGNGLSSLNATSSNSVFELTTLKGDTIGAVGTNATVLLHSSLTSANFSLLDTFGHGAGIAAVSNLEYLGSGPATLSGNSLNNYIEGGYGNDFLAGGGGSDTLDASASHGNVTLVGNSNGSGQLIGGYNKNYFYLNNSIPDLLYAQSGSHNSIISKFSYDASGSNYQFDSLSYTGAGNVAFAGNALGHTTLNSGIASNATLSDGGGVSDCLCSR